MISKEIEAETGFLNEILFNLRHRISMPTAIPNDLHKSMLFATVELALDKNNSRFVFNSDEVLVESCLESHLGNKRKLLARDFIQDVLKERGFLKPKPDPEIVLWDKKSNTVYPPTSLGYNQELILRIRDITHYQDGEGYGLGDISYKIGNTGELLQRNFQTEVSCSGVIFKLDTESGELHIINECTDDVVFFCTAYFVYRDALMTEREINFSFDAKTK